MTRLAQKVAVVTGGGRGLGRAVAHTLADAGASVVVTGRSEDALSSTVTDIQARGGVATHVVADVTEITQLESLRKRVNDCYGPTDILVNNSGIAGPSAPLWEVDPSAWDETFAVNVRGVFLACRTFLPDMIERRSGAIVNIGSMTGKRPLAARTAYAASKTALVGLTRTLAHEVGPHGLRVNLVSPGGIEGERIERVISNLAKAEGVNDEEARQRFTDPSPLKRLVSAEDVARTVAFLASDEASSVTGEDLNVSAGVVMY